MKKLFIITVLMALAISGFSQINYQFDFSFVCETGQTLYYRITSEEEHTVILTYPYSENHTDFSGEYYQGYPIPQGEIIIPENVFYNDSQYSVTAIDHNTFFGCTDITSIFIPNNVNFIASRAFAHNESLESITVDEDNPTFYSENNAAIRSEDKTLVVGCKTTTIPNDIEIIDSCAFWGSGNSGDLIIPNSVRVINEHAFAYSGFSGSIILSESLETIGDYAFYYSSISGPLTIPNSVTEIGERAFWNCQNLTGDLTLPSSISTIENTTFSGCSFSGTLIIPNSVIQIGTFAFNGNNFSELILGESVTTIEHGAFLGCNNLTGALRLPASLIEINSIAFKNTSFDEIYSPNTVPPTLVSSPFSGYDTNIPIHISKGCTEAYQNDEGWSYFTNFIEPEKYYGFLYQPINATITLDPNSSMGSEYDDFEARFQYYPNGLLNMQRALSVYPNGGGCDYDHTYWFTYDSDFHVIQQNDTYYGDWGAAPYQNRYIYEDGLLMAFSRYYNDYHAGNSMILEDSISYAYDGLRRLQTEERFVSTTTVKNYEYNENEVVITTEGYSSGIWMTLTQETRTFSQDSILLSIQTEKYNDSATLVTYGYDEQGHRVNALTQKRNNGVWENQKLVQYHFNPIGRLTLAEIQLWQENEWINANRAVYELDEMGYPAVVTFEKWDGEAWVNGVWQNDFYLYNEDYLKQQNDLLYSYRGNINKIELSYTATDNPREPFLPDNSEWYYEIENEDGTITFQHLECAADTTINNERPTVIVRSNTQYDRDSIYTEVTHEYVYEKNGKVYWWNKDLQEFTMLYDLAAEVGDEWKIYVKHDSITMHVDAVENIEYEGRTYKMLHVSDESGFFSGDIVCGIGHLTSFFPERLMGPNKGYRVSGIRCYWIEDELVFKYGDEDCDAVYAQIHAGVEENGPSTSSRTLTVYPNPTNDILFVETWRAASLPDPTYRITNLMGQTVLSGSINAETQQINIKKLPTGMYFITVGGQTVKFVVK